MPVRLRDVDDQLPELLITEFGRQGGGPFLGSHPPGQHDPRQEQGDASHPPEGYAEAGTVGMAESYASGPCYDPAPQSPQEARMRRLLSFVVACIAFTYAPGQAQRV